MAEKNCKTLDLADSSLYILDERGRTMDDHGKHVEQVNGCNITIEPDHHAESPRDWDNMGTMACFHRRDNYGDADHGFTPESLQEHAERSDVVSLPIFMMDHSGVTILTDPTVFRAFDPKGWDWGMLGYIVVDQARIKAEYGDASQVSQEKALKVLQCEVDAYNDYLRGNVWQYEVTARTGEHVGSCGGFVGDYDGQGGCLEQARDDAKAHKNPVEECPVG